MLSRQEQRWLLHALIEGQERHVRPQQFDDPMLRGCYEAVADLPAAERRATLIDYLATYYANWKEIYESLMAARAPEGARFSSYADLALTMPPIDWFWQGWIPNRLLCALAAPPGVGKSLIALDLARRTIAGSPCPDGSVLHARSQNVIYVDAENVPQVTTERARSWEIALDRMYPILPRPYSMIDLNEVEDRDRLVHMSNGLEPGLIVIDSLSAATSRGEDNVEEVRPLFAFLTALAKDVACAVLLIHHTRKRPHGIDAGIPLTLDDVRGSGHIVASCRSILGLNMVQVGPQPDRNGPRRLEVLKTNLGAYPEPLGITLEAGEGGGVEVRYGPPPRAYVVPTATGRCADWLLSTLAGTPGPMKPQEVVRAAKAAGFSRAVVYRARRQLAGRIANTKSANSPENRWVLGQEEPSV